MKFRVVSDIHNEFYDRTDSFYSLPVMNGDDKTCLILAGDIGVLASPRTYARLIDNLSKRFMYVFWIEGNHEFYHGNIDKHSVSSTLHEWHNVFTKMLVLPEEKIVVLGCTLWSDFDGGSPLSMFEANQGMNDFKIVRKGVEYSKFKAENARAIHHVQKRALFNNIEQYKNLGYKVVVVTHHHPSFKGVGTDYVGDSLNGAYCSELFEDIQRTGPDIWCCGHIHEHKTYMVADTTVICNPLGYPWESTGFDSKYTFNLKNYD